MKFKLFASCISKPIYIAFLLCMGVGFAQAQKIVVKGTVTGDGDVLPGASVLVKGVNKGAITDFDGNYEIEADANATLIFSFMGYSTVESKINGNNTVNVVLEAESNALEEVVVVGYGTQKKKEVTGAVVSVKAAELEKTTTSDLGAALQGQMAGVNVTASSGAPGEEANILIRGFGSLLDGNSSPLYVVDGIPYDSDPQLAISEIESIDVLKDAASASIYGTRGSNGVILITTKQGKVGQMDIRVNSEYGVQKIMSDAHAMTSEEFTYIETLRGSLNSGKVQGGVEGEIHRNARYFTNNTDLAEIILNDLAPIQNHSVNVSGGVQGLTYSFNANYYDQQGIMVNSGYKRFNVRSNTQFTKGKWKVTTGLTFRRDSKKIPNNQNNVMNKIYDYRPFQDYIDLESDVIENASDQDLDDWEIGSARQQANVARNFKIFEDRTSNSHSGNAQFDYSATKELKFTVRGGATYNDQKGVRISPKVDVFNNQGELIPNTQVTSNRTSDLTTSKLTFEAFANYTKKIQKHSFKFLALFSYEKSNTEYYQVEKRDNINPAITVFDNYALVYAIDSNDRDGIRVNRGNLARIQYNYDGKYLLSASGRYDGSSQFGSENRWGFFPSVSAGWNVSDEYFWDPVKDVVNSFKIRASIGTTGNDRFALYSNQSVVVANKNYVFGSNNATSGLSGSGESYNLGTSQQAFANEELKWETNVETNIGYDFGFFRNALTISTDIYKSEKKDLLFPVKNAPSTGVNGNSATTIFNIGNMENSGVEYAVKYRHKGKATGFNWNVAATYTQNNNIVTKTSLSNPLIRLDNSHISSKNGASAEDVSVITEGHEAASFFLRETIGVIKTAEQLADYQANTDPTARMGELMYKDQNGDGVIDDQDQIYMGSGTPDFEVGLNFSANYKRFDFSMQWYGSFGAEIMNGSKAYAYQSGTHKDLFYSWTVNNPTSNIPWNDGANSKSYRGASDYFMEDGTYVRLRNVQLGYSFAKKVLERIGASRLRLYVQAQNPVTFTKYTGIDPEVGNNGLSTRGIDAGRYPISSQYKLGLQFQF